MTVGFQAVSIIANLAVFPYYSFSCRSLWGALHVCIHSNRRSISQSIRFRRDSEAYKYYNTRMIDYEFQV